MVVLLHSHGGDALDTSSPSSPSNITVLVGPTQKSYTIAQDLIASHSDFFKAATSSRWKERQDQRIHLPELGPGVFDAYLHWLYEDEVTMTNLADCPTLDLPDANLAAATWLTLVPLWLAAQFLADLPLRNAVIDKLLRYFIQGELVCFPGPQSINMVWENTTPGSTIGRLMLDVLNAYYQPKYVRECWGELDEEVEEELRKDYDRNLRCTRDAIRRVVRWEYVVPDPAAAKRCFYHEHDGRFPMC